MYRLIFTATRYSSLRIRAFGIFDGIRSLVRPRLPAASTTMTLVFAFALLGIFLTMTLIFREKLQVSDTLATNLFATNILESDVAKVRDKYGDNDLYSVLRGRLVSVNKIPLAKFVAGETPSGEFTREFSITTNSLSDIPLVA